MFGAVACFFLITWQCGCIRWWQFLAIFLTWWIEFTFQFSSSELGEIHRPYLSSEACLEKAQKVFYLSFSLENVFHIFFVLELIVFSQFSFNRDPGCFYCYCSCVTVLGAIELGKLCHIIFYISNSNICFKLARRVEIKIIHLNLWRHGKPLSCRKIITQA